jgi:sensor histidine kinase YesM
VDKAVAYLQNCSDSYVQGSFKIVTLILLIMPEKNKDYNKYRLYGYPFFWVLLYLVFFLINPFEQSFKDWEKSTTSETVTEIISAFIFGIIIFETGIQLSLFLNKRIPWEIAPKRRFSVQLSLQVLLLTVIFSIAFLLPIFPEDKIDWLIFRQALVVGIIFSLLITSFLTAEYFFKRMSASKIEALKQKQTAVQFQLEALKTQIDPHFLFNNFSTLTALIEDDKELALKYLQRLSAVYRYLLTNRNQHIIPLEDELAFINAYFFLYKIRYGEAINLQVDIDKIFYKQGIPPLTLQLLIENAVKHNTVSNKEPLQIHIFTNDNNAITVQNNVNVKSLEEPSSKMGLKNIEERYGLLSNQLPEITHTSTSFKVKVPLLHYAR